MEGHEYCLGHMDGRLFRGDLCYEQGKVHWVPYTLEDAVNAVSEWNYDLLSEAEYALLFSFDPEVIVERISYRDSLREDEKILDSLFGCTSYGKEIEALGVTLAEALIEDMSRDGEIDAAVKKMTDQIKEGVDQQPDVSPTVKKNGGKSR